MWGSAVAGGMDQKWEDVENRSGRGAGDQKSRMTLTAASTAVRTNVT